MVVLGLYIKSRLYVETRKDMFHTVSMSRGFTKGVSVDVLYL